MLPKTTTLLITLFSALAIQAAPTPSTTNSLQTRTQSDLDAEVAAADALDKRVFTYPDEEEEEDDTPPVKRWIQNLVARAVEGYEVEEVDGEGEVVRRGILGRREVEEEKEGTEARRGTLGEREEEEEEEVDETARAKRWIEGLFKRAVVPGAGYSGDK